MQPLAIRSHEEMKDVLMDPEAKGPDVHYYMIRGGSEKRNITVWETGTVGGEFIKTYGHYHIQDINERYEVLEGRGVLLIQDRKLDEEGKPINDQLESVKAIFVKAGDAIDIPNTAGHLMINIGKTWLVTSDNSPVAKNAEEKASWPEHADYSAVKEMHGFGYYVVEKGGEVEFVKNPNYREVPELIIEGNLQ